MHFLRDTFTTVKQTSTVKMVREGQPASLLLCVLALASQSSVAAEDGGDPLIVQTSFGPVQGFEYTSNWTKKPVYAFRGIPFAAPPVGELRFKDPVPPEKWSAVLNCSEDRPSCMQNSDTVIGYRNVTFEMSEDCLYLNVHTPKVPKEGDLLPVMVWVYGGAFLEGSGSYFRYGSDHLVAEDVIVVAMNYRLGALGFLSLGTSDVPGNAGMKDQMAALQWVQREIRRFGGNPENVTLFGESAGSVSVHLHYLSPLSKGLFQRVIGESGTALAKWAVREDAHVFGKKLAAVLNCTSDDLTVVGKCLREARAEDITAAQLKVVVEPKDVGLSSGALVFVPNIDKNSSQPFLPDTPARLVELKEGSFVPFIMGINSDEGMMFLGNKTTVLNITNNLDTAIPYDIRRQCSDARLKVLVQRIKNLYFKEPTSEKSIIRGYVDLYTDKSFGYSTAVSARFYRERAPVYLYYFAFDGKFKEIFAPFLEKVFNITGVLHAEELSYIFERETVIQEAAEDSNEMKTWRRMVRLWTNYAKFGQPTVGNDTLLQDLTWKPVGNMSTKYLLINETVTMVDSDFLAARVALWDTITPSASSTLHSTGLLVALGLAVYVWLDTRVSD